MVTRSAQRTVLITGSSGFSGRHLIEFLRPQTPPLRLVGFDCVESARMLLDHEIVGNLTNADLVDRALLEHRPDVVMHLAGRMPPTSEADFWTGNVGATCTLLESLRRQKLLPRVLVVGSAAEYGPVEVARISEDHPCQPTATYGRSKLAQSLLCQQYAAKFDLPIVIVRPFNLFGPGMGNRSVIGEICAQLAAGRHARRIAVGDLTAARDFIDVRDAVRAYWGVAQYGVPGEIYNVCTGRPVTIHSILERLLELAGGAYEVEAELTRFQPGDVAYSCGDVEKLARVCGFHPELDLPRRLRETLASFTEEALTSTTP